MVSSRAGRRLAPVTYVALAKTGAVFCALVIHDTSVTTKTRNPVVGSHGMRGTDPEAAVKSGSGESKQTTARL